MKKLFCTSIALAALAICSISSIAFAHPAHAGPAFYVHSKLYPTSMPIPDKGAAAIAKSFAIAAAGSIEKSVLPTLQLLTGNRARDSEQPASTSMFASPMIENRVCAAMAASEVRRAHPLDPTESFMTQHRPNGDGARPRNEGSILKE